MSNGKLRQIGIREGQQKSRSLLYLLALVAAILVVVAALAMAIRAIGFSAQ